MIQADQINMTEQAFHPDDMPNETRCKEAAELWLGIRVFQALTDQIAPKHIIRIMSRCGIEPEHEFSIGEVICLAEDETGLWYSDLEHDVWRPKIVKELPDRKELLTDMFVQMILTSGIIHLRRDLV
jgi:hypothetical protein